MTEQDLQYIERIAVIAQLPVTLREDGVTVIEKKEGIGEGFYWSSDYEGFGEFIQELINWQYERGYSRRR